MAQKKWQPLEKGDSVEIIAPGMRPQPGTMSAIPKFLKSWGIEPVISKNILGKDLICANNLEMRLMHLKNALKNPDTKMIWCARGGYGSFQLLPFLKKIKPSEPKIFMGLSDITSLHTFLVQDWGWSTIHGCNIDRLARGEASPAEMNRFKRVLFGKTKSLDYQLKPLNSAARKSKKLSASIVGGNLITLQANFGTDFQIKTRGKVLFIEDIGERAYRVDRVLEQMNQLGLLKGLKGMVLGQFTGGREPGGVSLVPMLLKEFAERQSFPVVSGFQSGHGPNQHPLPLATKAQFSFGSKVKLQISTGAR